MASSRRRVLALIFGALVVVLFAGNALAVLSVRSQLVDDIDRSLETRVDEVAAALDIPEMIEAAPLGARPDAIGIIDGGGETVAFSPAGSPDEPLGVPDVTAAQILDRLDAPFTVGGLDGGPRYRVLASRLDDGRVLGVARPLDGVRDTITDLIVVQLLANAGVVLVLAGVIWAIIRSSQRPIEEMIDTAETIAGGDYSRRADMAGSTSEVGRLGGSINIMLDQVQTSFAEKAASEARLKQFVSDASHELRTPLTSISGYSELYLSGAATDRESVEKQMNRINAEAARIGGLVDDLLTLARLDEPDSEEGAEQQVELGALVDAIVTEAESVDPERAIHYDRALATVSVTGDAGRLRRALGSLLENARHHTPPGTNIDVAVLPQGDRVRLLVCDDGPGMDTATVAAAFDRFYRADVARHRSSGGSGLGLAIAKSIIEAHGGTIELESAPGNGARFTVDVPCSAAHHPGGSGKSEVAATGPPALAPTDSVV